MRLLVLLLTLLVCVDARAQQVAYKPDPVTGAINLQLGLPPEYQTAVRLQTQTIGLADYVQAAVDAACGTANRTLWVPNGSYPMEHGVELCAGLQIVCSQSGQRNTTRFWATQDFAGQVDTRDAMFYAGGIDNVTISGCWFDANITRTDILRFESCNYFDVSDNHFQDTRGVLAAQITSVNTSTDFLTTASFAGFGSQLTVGSPVIFRVKLGSGALPSPLVADTTYWIVAKGTSREFQVSTTFGGAAVNITGSGSGEFYWFNGLVPFDDSNVNLTTDTFTLPRAGGFTNGWKFEFCQAADTPRIVGWAATQMLGAPMWVINADATAGTFQLSFQPGGAPLDFDHDGGNNQFFCAAAGALVVAQSLYGVFDGNHMQARAPARITAHEGYGPHAGPAPYGCNACTFSDNHMNSAARLMGSITTTGNSFESATDLPFIAAVEWMGTSLLDGNYFELFAKWNPGHGILTTGLGTGTAGYGTFSGNVMYGPNSFATSIGIVISKSQTQAFGNVIYSFSQAFSDAISPATDTSDRAQYLWMNSTELSTTNGVALPAFEDASTNRRGLRLVEFPLDADGGFWSFSGGGIVPNCLSQADPTSIDVTAGNCWMFSGSGNTLISTVTNGTRLGANGWIHAATDVRLGGSAFTTLSGADVQLRAGETVYFYSDGVKPVLRSRLGDAVDARTLTLSAQVSSATNIFSGNVTAGEYEVCASGYVDTAGTAGTYDVEIAATDAIGARTVTVISGASLASQTRSHGCVTLRTNGSSNVTYRVPWTGVTGSPVLSLPIKTRRVR